MCRCKASQPLKRALLCDNPKDIDSFWFLAVFLVYESKSPRTNSVNVVSSDLHFLHDILFNVFRQAKKGRRRGDNDHKPAIHLQGRLSQWLSLLSRLAKLLRHELRKLPGIRKSWYDGHITKIIPSPGLCKKTYYISLSWVWCSTTTTASAVISFNIFNLAFQHHGSNHKTNVNHKHNNIRIWPFLIVNTLHRLNTLPNKHVNIWKKNKAPAPGLIELKG